ncbi:MAG: COX15/CtaA family protein [Betaproteobacteria bacterium]|nr:COX15/CtaA family protein [Betaproteobacteria bacterium]
MGARHLRRGKLRAGVRAQALCRAPGAARARQGRGPDRAPVARDRRRTAGRAAARRHRGHARCRGVRGPRARLCRRRALAPLSRRSARQPDDALSVRCGPGAPHQGPRAAVEIFEHRVRALRLLSIAAASLALVVVVLGAYVRLSDAGLGCPDWPLCYGKPLPAEIADAGAHAKAWKEMAHRYLAGTLGLLIVALAVAAWRVRRSRSIALAVVLLVVFQATLGMWTVTMLLKPAIVTAHLLGGMATLALLVWLALSQWPPVPAPHMRALRAAALLAFGAAAVQIALGGWVSANYAALACPDLPLCRGTLLPAMNFADAFHLVRELGRTGEGELLPIEALTAIHWTHRVFAVVALVAVLAAAARALRVARPIGVVLAALVVLQFGLGLANVALALPLPLAAAHNAGAALLLAALVVLNFFAFRGLRPSW